MYVEEVLQERLIGRRLVCEIDWEPEILEEARVDLPKVVRIFHDMLRQVFDKYPALLVLYLVDHGSCNYEANDFWTGTPFSGPSETRAAGLAFEAAIERLGLERFPQFNTLAERPLRYVARILAHGGIPQAYMGRFLGEALLPALADGLGTNAAELIGAWRRSTPTGMTRPVQRFLLYGGETAADFLDRCIDLVRLDRDALTADPAMAGLPLAVVESFLALPAAVVSRSVLRPRPSVRFYPWGDRGPVAILPPVGRELAPRLRWEIHDGAGLQTVSASAVREQTVALYPAGTWTVCSEIDGQRRSTVFDGLGANPIVTFATDGRFLDDTRSLRGDAIWILARPDVEVLARDGDGLRPLPVREEGAEPAGAWQGFLVRRYELAGLDELIIRDHGAEQHIPLSLPGAGPEMVGMPLRDITGVDGAPVYASMPQLSLPAWGRWLIVVRDELRDKIVFTREDVIGERRTVEIGKELPSRGSIGRYELLVRGPLGADLRLRFAVVPELIVGTPDGTVLPPAATVAVPLTAAPGVGLHGARSGEHATLHIPAGETVGEVWVRGDGSKCDLLVSVPRLRWGLRSAGAELDLGTSLVSLEPASIGVETDAILFAGVRAGHHLELALEAGVERLQSESFAADGAGRALVPLDRFRDTAQAAEGRPLRLALGIEGSTVLLAEHRPAVKPSPQRVLPRRGDQLTGHVEAVLPDRLYVRGPGWEAVAYADRLPKRPEEYERGQAFSGWLVRDGDPNRFSLDGCPFDEHRFGPGITVHGNVVWAGDGGLVLDLGGTEGRVPRERLPADRPAESFTIGQVAEAHVVGMNARSHFWRLSMAPFDVRGFAVGETTEGRVLRTTEAGIMLDLGLVIGFVPARELPPGRSIPDLAGAGVVKGWVTRIDREREQIEVSMLPFAPRTAVGEVVEVHVSNATSDKVWVELPDRTRGYIALSQVHQNQRQDLPAHFAIGSAVKAKVVGLNKKSRLAICSIIALEEAYSFGDVEPESPFSSLKD
jgi:hypothetical protein